MKKLIAMLLALTMVLSLAACGAKTETAPATEATKAETATETTTAATETEPTVEPATLNIAYMPNWGALWAVATGIEKGYFAEEGLELNLVQFDAGPAEIAAMEQGSIDIAYIGKGAHKLCPNGTADILLLQHMGDGDSIIGLGGIETGEDAAAVMLCGAKAVQVGTANFTDPFACPRIVKELDAYCDAQGVGNPQEIVGTLKAY